MNAHTCLCCRLDDGHGDDSKLISDVAGSVRLMSICWFMDHSFIDDRNVIRFAHIYSNCTGIAVDSTEASFPQKSFSFKLRKEKTDENKQSECETFQHAVPLNCFEFDSPWKPLKTVIEKPPTRPSVDRNRIYRIEHAIWKGFERRLSHESIENECNDFQHWKFNFCSSLDLSMRENPDERWNLSLQNLKSLWVSFLSLSLSSCIPLPLSLSRWKCGALHFNLHFFLFILFVCGFRVELHRRANWLNGILNSHVLTTHIRVYAIESLYWKINSSFPNKIAKWKLTNQLNAASVQHSFLNRES